MKTATHNTAPHKRGGGGGNNLSLNPQKSSLRGSVTTEAIHKNKAESMDCHAVQAPLAMTEKIAATTHTAPSKSASLSLACAIALSSVLIPNQAKADQMLFNNKRTGSAFDGRGNCTSPCQYGSIAYTVDNGHKSDLTFGISGASVDTLTMQSSTQDSHWRNIRLNTSTQITTANTTGHFKVEFKTSGSGNNSTITTINNAADCLSLRAENGSSITVTTLNQSKEGSGLALQNSGGNITITNLNLQGGDFTQNAGQITTLTQSGGTANQNDGSTITTLNLKGGVFNHNGGTLTTINLQDGNGVFNNNAQNTNFTINQEGGDHTIGGKITTFNQNAGSSTIAQNGTITTLNLKSGSLTNNGSIETLTTNTTTTRALRNAQAATTNHITNNGTIDKLELTKDATSVTNNAVYNTGGGLASGIIKELDVKSGNATINTLNGVGQGTAGNIEPHTLSNIKITKDAKLTVDTLSVGLKGNQAIERVTINNNTGSNGGNKEFAANKIQVTYLDGSFDPAKSISKNLKDYVTSGTSQTYVDQSSKPTFESSPELQG
uniref:hypothetical protein n=1 Tax=Helicobacter canis TaxID=29419 RepID=UPI0029423464